MNDKKQIINLFIAEIERLLAALTLSAKEAHAAATHAESKAEDKYDTRGLEASYLAGAQSRRAMELAETLDLYRFLDLKEFKESDPIVATACVELRAEDGRSLNYLLMPAGGGMSVVWQGRKIQTITPQSPLGEALLGKKCGDEISIRIESQERDYEIIAVH